MKTPSKRASFTSTQASQMVASTNYQLNSLRTGYGNIIAHRTSKLYSMVAKQGGKVSAVEKDCLTVEYNDGTRERYPLGLTIGEASGEYHRHDRVTDLVVGQVFKKGEVLGWDKMWFARDPFCPGQVEPLLGRMYTVVMVEDESVYEDSIAISTQVAQESRTPFIKQSSFALEVEKNLLMKVKIGDVVEQDAILCNIEDAFLGDDNEDNPLAGELNTYGIKQIRSKHHGTVIDIQIRYNSPLEKMSESIRSIALKADKVTRRKGDIDGSGVENNAISNAFQVTRPTIAPGKAFVTIYIESLDASTTADKWVLGNQLKATVGLIMKRPLKTETGRVVDMKASFKGMFNRMVLNMRNKLVANEYGYQHTLRAIKLYRGK